MFEKVKDKTTHFFKNLSQFFEARWETAYRTGATGTAGKIRNASEKLYNRLLGKISLIIELMPILGIHTTLGFINQADKALLSELETDNAALNWTPPGYTHAQKAHEALREGTLAMINELNDLKGAFNDAGVTEEVVQGPLMDPTLCEQRKKLVQDYIDFRSAEATMYNEPQVKTVHRI